MRPRLLLVPLAATAAALVAPGPAHAELRLVRVIGGAISPKSVVASQTGLVFAQNMIYRHTITVYDRRHRLVRTIPDAVRLPAFGVAGPASPVRGGPVEAAFSPGGRYAYVSNYSMYGPGFSRPGDDVCSPGMGLDRSYVYRVDARRLRIDRVIRVGEVPKYVATTPDGRLVLVTNWCGYDLSVIDVARQREVRQVPLGAYPRGIAVSPRGRFAYVAVMGSHDVARVNLRTFQVRWIRGVGNAPRDLRLDPTGRHLYATLNGAGRVVKVDLARQGRVVASTATGRAPRSMAMSPDGRFLYVVNYESASVSKVRTRDMAVVGSVPTAAHPIGVTYDNATRSVWVACYSGSIMVFRDR